MYNEYLLLGTVGVTMTSSEPGTTTGGLMKIKQTLFPVAMAAVMRLRRLR